MLTNLKRTTSFAKVSTPMKMASAGEVASQQIKANPVTQKRIAMRSIIKEKRQEPLAVVDSTLDPRSIAILCVVILSGLKLGKISKPISMQLETPAIPLQDGRNAVRRNFSINGNAQSLKLSTSHISSTSSPSPA